MPLIDQDQSLKSLTKAVELLLGSKMNFMPKIIICIRTKTVETTLMLCNLDIHPQLTI